MFSSGNVTKLDRIVYNVEDEIARALVTKKFSDGLLSTNTQTKKLQVYWRAEFLMTI